MVIEEVWYRNFRNIADARVEFAPGTNVIWGQNAQGKTNVLEGIYFFARGKSFRAAAERELVRLGERSADASVTFRRQDTAHSELLSAHIPISGRKTLERDGVVLSGVSEMLGELCAVLFAPSHLALVSGSPGDRRSFLDIAIAQLLPAYIVNLRRYNRVLEQRNALIRQASQGLRVTDAEWESFADVMADFGAYIAAARLDYVSNLVPRVAEILSQMTLGAEGVELLYKTQVIPDGAADAMPSADGAADDADAASSSEDGENGAGAMPPADDAEGGADIRRTAVPAVPCPKPLRGIVADSAARAHLKSLLCDNLEREIKAGFTLYGVHKDDITIRLDSLEARQFCSQGQRRSISLAMKLAEGEISHDATGEYPVFLLDDVLSELDASRREYILSSLEGRQIIVTSCEPEIYDCQYVRRIEISGGEVISVLDGHG